MSDSDTFVPQSLLDTIQGPSRTYSSARAPLPRSTSTGGPRPSHAHSSSFSSAREKREREATARDDAAAMSRMLGLDVQIPGAAPPNPTTPTPTSSGNHSELEVSRLKATLADKDGEIASLRRQVAGVAKEKADLARKCERLEREAATGGGGVRGGIGAKELEDLEKAFASQESLLSGYQKDAERSMMSIEALKKQNTRLSQFLEKLYGPSWETDLATHLARPSTSSLPLPLPHSASSPSIRPNGPRPSILNSPNRSTHSSSSFPDLASPSHDGDDDAPMALDAVPSAKDPALSPEAMREHLESVQILLRGMERRLIAREVALDAVEKRAREGAEEAKRRGEDLRSIRVG
ncbi:hypothetical protein P7C70_g7003, partial [Phenoliferia sp. Uapishka_3]